MTITLTPHAAPAPPARRLSPAARWLVVAAPLLLLLLTPPADLTAAEWRLCAIFAATMLGLMVQPLPGGAMVLLGVTATALVGSQTPAQALAGYGDPIVWLVLAAFFLARGMLKTGLGRRIALGFIRLLGGTSLGLSYSLVLTDGLLATTIPSNLSRLGGIVFPITRSIAESYDSAPGETARRLGAFLMVVVYQCGVVVCAMFLTGQASNPLIASLASSAAGVELSYGRWALGALVPGLATLMILPALLHRLFPPEVTRTPGAQRMAAEKLAEAGPMSGAERMMLAVFGAAVLLWLTSAFHPVHYAVVAMSAVGLLLLSRVLEWEDLTHERAAWDVFIWYGGLVQLARALSETGITQWFATVAAGWTAGWQWPAALALLALTYFYAHYAFASITAHATAMYVPFLVVVLAAGAPLMPAVLLLAYLSNLCAGLTHYGTTPAPIYFGAGYVDQATWWRLGLLSSFVTIPIFAFIGLLWWRVLGWW